MDDDANSTGTPSWWEHENVEYFVYLYLIPLVCVPGVVTAALSSTIFFRMRRTSLDVLLCGLSLFDVILLFCSLVLYPPMALCLEAQRHEMGGRPNQTLNSSHEGNSVVTYPFVCHFFWRTTLAAFPISNIAQVGSVWMCVAVTVDRFLAVSLPMRRITFCTPANAAASVAAITLFSVLYKLPAAFEITLLEDGSLNPTELSVNPIYYAITKVYGYLMILLVLPWTTIIVLNVIIIRKIRKAYNLRSTLTNSKPRSERKEEAERRMTVMSVLVATLFIITNVPSAMNNIIDHFFFEYSGVARQRIPLSNLLVCINSANNMLIYIVFNRKFRQFVIEMLTPWVNKRRRSSSRCSTLLSELERSKNNSQMEKVRYGTDKGRFSNDSLSSMAVGIHGQGGTPLSRGTSVRRSFDARDHPHRPLLEVRAF